MAGYHPLLFTLLALLAMAELGLSAFWVHQVQHDPSNRFKSLVILFLFNSVWTTLFAGAYVFWIIDGTSRCLSLFPSRRQYIQVRFTS